MSEPYYQDDLVTLFHGDCLEVAEWLDADVLVTDPPYGMEYIGDYRRSDGSRTDRVEIAGDTTLESRRAALSAWGDKPGLVFGTWRMPRPEGTKNLIVWDKGDSPGVGNTNIPWGLSHEEIYVVGTWPLREAGYGGPRSGSVIRAASPAGNARPDHPTPKPVGLMEALITKCPAGAIADPFAGSGSTLIAARNIGRKSIGVELEERYCELIAKRLSQQAFDFGNLEDEVRASGWAHV